MGKGFMSILVLTGVLVIAFQLLPFSSLNPREFFTAWECVAQVRDEADSPVITKFKVDPLYRSAKITWRVSKSVNSNLSFEIYRSQGNAEGTYELIATIEYEPEKHNYIYVDKSVPVEENYFYKIVVPTTGESHGPLQVRPPFSLPST